MIQTTLDFGARFPGHRGVDTNPAEVRRQRFLATLFLDTRVLSRILRRGFTIARIVLSKIQSLDLLTTKSQNRKPDPALFIWFEE